MELTRSKKLRMWAVAGAVSLGAGLIGAIFFYDSSDDGGKLGGFIFTSIVYLPLGLILGWSFVRPPRRKPGPDDVERDWWMRARAQAFLDMTVLASFTVMVSAWIPSVGDADVALVLLLLGLVGVLDLGFHYWRIRIKEQW